MAREKRARKSNVAAPVPEKTEKLEKPVEPPTTPQANGKKHMNGEITPKNDLKSPKLDVKSPKLDVKSPKPDVKSPKTVPQTPAQQKVKGGGGSQCVLLTQGIMANDSAKIDSVIRNMNTEVINATLRDLQPMQVLPLLKIIESRLKTRGASDIRPTIRWAQSAFSIHMPYLSSLPNLEKQVGGLISWLRSRVSHHKDLLALHGKISTIADLIKRRTNNVVIVQQPLVVFNNDLDSDSEDFDTIASDEDGESSEDDWWEDNELKEDGENQEGEEEDDNDSDESEMDAESGGSGQSGSEDDDDDDEEEDMEVG